MIHQLDVKKRQKQKREASQSMTQRSNFARADLKHASIRKKNNKDKRDSIKFWAPNAGTEGFRSGQLNKETIQNPRLGGSSRRGWKRKLYLNASEEESSGCLFVCSISLPLKRTDFANSLLVFWSVFFQSLTLIFLLYFLFYDFFSTFICRW